MDNDKNFEILSVAHIGIAPKEAEALRRIFSGTFLLKHLGDEDIVEQKTAVSMWTFQNDEGNVPSLEILSPMDEGSPIAKFLKNKKSGIHHIALRVKNIEALIEHCLNDGLKMIDTKPKIGAHGSKVAFIHPQSTGGILLELVELMR